MADLRALPAASKRANHRPVRKARWLCQYAPRLYPVSDLGELVFPQSFQEVERSC